MAITQSNNFRDDSRKRAEQLCMCPEGLGTMMVGTSGFNAVELGVRYCRAQRSLRTYLSLLCRYLVTWLVGAVLILRYS